MASTVRDVIASTMRLIGVSASGETITAAEQNDAISSLNDMLDSWSLEGLMIYQTVREAFAFTAGKSVYTIGPSTVALPSDFNTARPTEILRAAIQYQTDPPVEIPISMLNLDQWADVVQKNAQSSQPVAIRIDMGAPLTTINVWPVPTDNKFLVLYSHKPIGTFVNATDPVVVPPGYMRAIRYGLAVELAPEYGKQLDPAIVAEANSARERIKRNNSEEMLMISDVAGLVGRKNRFNILTGE